MDAPKTKFLKVKCKDCENEQIIFGSATSRVDCAVCGSTLAEPRGGKALIKSQNPRSSGLSIEVSSIWLKDGPTWANWSSAP